MKSACTSVLTLPYSANSLGVSKKFGEDTAGTADPNWPMLYHVTSCSTLKQKVFPKYLLLEDGLSIGLLVVNDCLCIDCFALFLHLLNCLYLNSQVFFLVFCCCCCYFCCCCCSLVCLFFLGFALPIFSLILGQGSEWHQPKDNLFIHIGGVAL